jgi:quercetin dioxygenase-like cupin family protein
MRYLALLALCVCGVAHAQQAVPKNADVFIKAGTNPTVKGAVANFTGDVQITPLFNPPSPGRATTGQVTFAPGARTHWHSHPAGQTLIVTNGCGWTQVEGGPIHRMCAGDVVWVPPGVRHWHGATDTTSVTHIAVSETIDGKNVNWAEAVSDADYAAGKGTR